MRPIALLVAAFLATPGGAIAQSAVVVNGEPLAGDDIHQSLLWQGYTDGCINRLKTLLTGEVYHPKDREVRSGPPPTQEEAQQEAERIKKLLIADAIEEAISNKLKLWAAKKLGIDISDAEVEKTLAVCADPGPDGKPDMNVLYAGLRKFGNNGLAMILGGIRVQLAWRKVIQQISGAEPRDTTYDSSSRSYLQELRQKAIIDHR